MVCLRYTSTSNYYCAALTPTGVQIKTVVGGTAAASSIWASTAVTGTSYNLGLSINASGVLTATLGGTVMGTYTPAALATAGSAAVGTVSMEAEFDNVVVTQ